MPDNTITTEELFSLEGGNQTTTSVEDNNLITTEELLALGKTIDPASGTDSGSESGSSVSPETESISWNSEELEHISEEEFMSISSEDFGTPIFGKGREEIMTEKLYETYNPEKDPNKIQFEQFGSGNNFRVTLPNGEEEEFTLPGVGGLFGDEVGKVKNDHVRLTQFIQSDQKKLKVNEEKASQIESIILGRKRQGYGATQEERLKGDASGIVNDELDDNVARELNLLGLKNEKGSYSFEADRWYRNAILITTPGGVEKTINIGHLTGDDDEKKQKVLSSVMRFIESDPSSYEMTEEYNTELENLKKSAEPYLQKYIDNPEKSIDLLSETNKAKLAQQIKKKLKIDHQSWFGRTSNMTFQNITRDQQMELVNQTIQTTIDNAMDKISLDFSNKERKDLAKEGYDLQAVYDHVDKRTGERFSGLNKQIFDLNVDLDDPDLSETERTALVNKVNGLKHLKAQRTGEEYSYLIDMNTLTRSLSSGEEENVVDLTKEVESKSSDVQEENLTRAELKERYVGANLAYDEWEDIRNTEKRRFIVPSDKVENFYQTSGLEIKRGGDTKELMSATGKTYTEGQSYSYVTLTDKEASKYSYWLELDENAGYQSRLQHGVNLGVDREVYDKQYGLNEGIQSQNVQTWYESMGTNFVRGFTGKEYELNNGVPDDQFRQAFLDVQTNELGIEPTAEESESAKSTFGETTGAALSGLPKMVADFYVGNKVLAATGLVRTVGSLVNNLKKTRYAIKIGNKTRKLNQTQLLKHIGTTGKQWKKSIQGLKNAKPENAILGKEAIIRNWLKTMKYGDDVFVPASILNQGSAVALNGLLEGVKMEVAMQSPITQITGLGDPDDLPVLGSSYATGFGFGAASSLIPWNRMFRAVAGKNVGKGVKIPFTASKYPGPGGKIVPKEVSYKGMYDYLVAAPWSFYAGAQFGNFTNQIADNMMGNKSWNDWLDENYGDWNHVLKHTATELITGLALKMGHGKKYDFASENRLWRVQRKARKDLREKVYEDVVEGRDGQLYKKTVKNGVEMLEKITPEQIFRKGKSQVDADRLQSIESLATQRLHDIRDTKAYLDPIQGPIKFMEKWKPHLKELGETENFRFKFDNNIDKMNIKFVKGKDGKQITQATFNPRNVSIDYLPHELLHFMTFKKMGKKGEYTGEDVMFKNKAVDGMIELSKDMEYGDGRTLYEAMKEAGVLKEGRYKGEIQQTKEWELFSYIAEFYGKESNQEMIEAKYGYDKLASFTDKLIKDNFNGAHTPLNTQKDLVLFFGNYARNIGKGGGITGSLKHLEKFVSPTKTKRQQTKREVFEALNGVGETKQLKTQNLNKKITKKLEEIKSNPAFIQFQKDKDGEKYKKDPKTIKLLAELKTMKENLENIPEDVIWGKETPIEKTINNFARVGKRMMTSAEWNAKGGGKDKAMLELYKEDGVFVGIITRGLDFSKGGIEGRSRETWIEDVSFGIEGKGRKDKKTGERIPTFVTKGIQGLLENFKPETDLQGKESLSAWVNRQYQFRRGQVYNYYEANPLGQSLQKKAGEGTTVGDRLVASVDPRLERFEDVNILQEAIKEGKEAEFQEVVTVEGERRAKYEIPVSKEAFKPWEKTILDNMPSKEKAKDMGYRDIADLAPKFTESMYGVKLTDAQRKNLNDIGGETNLENFQKSVKADYSVSVMEKRTVDGKVEVREKINPDGTPATKKIKNSQRIADGLPSGTVKFDKGVSDALVGRSAFPRLGTLGELYHLATSKNYTRAELRELGFETNPKPHSQGHWRAATGPGGRIYIKGKAKGQKLTGKDVEQFVGIKDGKPTKLSADRSLGGKSRRIMSEDGRHITEQVMTESGNLDMNIVANFKGGKSRSFWTKTLSKVVDQKSREKFLEEIRSDAFHDEFYRQIETEFNKGKKGSQEKAVENAITKHFDLVRIKEGDNFKIEPKELKKIAKEIYKEFMFSRPEVVKQGLILRAKKAIERPNAMEGVEAKYISKGEKVEILDGPGKLFDKDTIRDGIVYEMKAVERLTKKFGVGVYEAHLLAGASGGGGIGKYSTLANMLNNLPGTLRYTIFRSANAKYAEGKGKAAEEKDTTYDAYAMLDAVYKKMASEKGYFKTVNGEQVPDVSRLKKYETELEDGTFVPTAKRANQTKVGVKMQVMKELGMLDKNAKEFNQKAADKLFEYGEINKKLLLDSVEGLMEAYKGGDASQRVVRQWVEMHAGSMDGLIKTSASLAALPNVKMSDLMKAFPANTPKIDKKTGKPERYKKDKLDKQGNVINKKGDIIYESNWVLEHMTPAQYIKARIYDYVLSKGDKTLKAEMELAIRDHHTTLIPKKYDTMVNEILQSDLGASYKPGVAPPLKNRYYEASHSADFDFGLKIFAGRWKGEVYDYHPNLSLAEKTQKRSEVGENIQKLFPKNFRNLVAKSLNSKNLDRAKTIDKALENGRNKQEKRGMSTWDFDDTLATTKSGVRARIPNADGKPKPNRKVIFLAGGAGSGKGNVIKKLNLEKQGFKIVNSDISLEWLKKNNGLPENMNDLTSAQRSKLGSLQHQARGIAKRKMMKYKGNADGVVVDGTGGSIKAMEKLVNEFKDKGYDVSMLFVETSLPTALARNKARAERSLLDKIVERNHEAVQGNKSGFKTMFGERFMEVKTDNLKQTDAMPKELVAKMKDFVSGYEKVRLDAEQFATEGQKILDKGGKFDFAEFNVVTGGEKGPFFQKALDRAKKFGTKDQFVLTARPPEAAGPIYEFLKSQGLDIPLKNITGLGNSTGEAKAMWMLEKFSEGYNDMYFADDAMQNVKAVRDVLNQLDVKSKVQQAKQLNSRNLGSSINKIMEHSLGIDSKKVFSKAEAKVRGKDIKRRRVFMRDSAADLELLIEPLYGKGKEGIKNKKWFKENLVMPFERGIRDYNTARQSAKNDYMGLRKQNKDVVKEISKPVEGTAFTNDMAMRVYLWNKAGYKIPDLAKTTEAKLVQHVVNNPKLQAYAENFARITKQEKGLKEPGENWWGETMAGEVTNINRGVSRKQYLQEWIDVKNEIFTEANLNKMESKLGTEWRENITDMFDRMETGRTRSLKMDRGSAAMMNYLNGGIGTIMNFNTRSAVLQTISTTNFLNMRENNPIAAARAMGNVKQFAKDFKYIMNSDMLKQRRDGLAMNVTEAEIASAAASSKNPVQSIISKVLKAGYLPTKMADSFAISFGGATFYRNRVKMYEKQGMKTKEAENQAFLDFQVIAERTQQSSRADLLSKQQTSLVGRFILPFANTPMQMNRAGMKDILDISKGRYKNSAEVAEKVGRISYYMGAQVAIFAGLQSALFAMLLNDDDVPEEKIANTKSMMLNTTTDSMLRGFGVQGAVMSATKNALQEYFKQSAKPGFTADYSEVAEDLLNISPPIGSKFGMLDRAGDRKKWAKIRKNDEFKFELGNPSLEASLMTIQATTNAPVYSPYQNIFNMQHALSDQYETWQRVLMGAGWTPYSVGIETEDKKKKTKTRAKTPAEIIEARRRKFLKSR